MAYMRETDHKCDRCVQRSAMVEVRGNQNQSHGHYCRPCGKAKLRAVQDREDAIHKGNRT